MSLDCPLPNATYIFVLFILVLYLISVHWRAPCLVSNCDQFRFGWLVIFVHVSSLFFVYYLWIVCSGFICLIGVHRRGAMFD